MKRIITYSFLIIGLFVFSSNVKDIAGASDDISIAIKKGDAKALSAYFSNTVDLVLPGFNGAYSKAQADIIIKNFFKKYPPQSFKLVHKGLSGKGAEYAIGDYTSAKTNFRVYYLVKKQNTTYIIQQLRFETE